MYRDAQQQNLKAFDEWFGGWGCEGHPPIGYATKEEAENRKVAVESFMNGVRGIVEVKVEVVDRRLNGRFWVHNTSVYDTTAQASSR